MSGSEFETIYPKRCEGLCKLGPKALEMVNGVLGGNCPGPQLFSDETVALHDSTVAGFDFKPTLAADRDRLACTNPRLIRAVWSKIDNEIEQAIVDSVEMDI